MKRLAEIYIRWVQNLLPSPLSIAFALTAVCVLMAIAFTAPQDQSIFIYSLEIFDFWSDGIWGLLAFTTQMMFILVMGHALALSKPAARLIQNLVTFCTTHAKAAFTVTLITVISGFINWGFGLIFGAIMARKVYEFGQKNGQHFNYPLLAACGYTGMMVWHGGISGSAPLTVAQAGHSLEVQMGVLDLSKTLFSDMNLMATLLCLIALPLFAIWLSKLTFQPKTIEISEIPNDSKPDTFDLKNKAERFDQFPFVGIAIGLAVLLFWVYRLLNSTSPIDFLGINTINLLFFALALLCHGSLSSFIKATDDAIRGAGGILIQFPLYAGIMGILSGSGLLYDSATFLVQITNQYSFPVLSFFSAAIVNIFVPSGGGQWQIQGPILIDAAKILGVDLGKTTMSLAYGDQLTNMLQPFWALPLLSVTGLKAKDILPYSIMFMLIGAVIFTLVLIMF